MLKHELNEVQICREKDDDELFSYKLLSEFEKQGGCQPKAVRNAKLTPLAFHICPVAFYDEDGIFLQFQHKEDYVSLQDLFVGGVQYFISNCCSIL